jgi:hypothetical protein
LERPALQRLILDIEAGRVDTVVCYKIDRLSRSLTDFAKLVDVFERNSVTFVSVTQSFCTTTSMGRLTLNILLSFDQVEIVDREPGIAPDRRTLEAGIRPVGIAAEHDVPVVIGKEELRAVLPRDPPDRREPRGVPVEMRPHGGGEVLGHGVAKDWRGGEGRRPAAVRRAPSTENTLSTSRLSTARSAVLRIAVHV